MLSKKVRVGQQKRALNLGPLVRSQVFQVQSRTLVVDVDGDAWTKCSE